MYLKTEEGYVICSTLKVVFTPVGMDSQEQFCWCPHLTCCDTFTHQIFVLSFLFDFCIIVVNLHILVQLTCVEVSSSFHTIILFKFAEKTSQEIHVKQI